MFVAQTIEKWANNDFANIRFIHRVKVGIHEQPFLAVLGKQSTADVQLSLCTKCPMRAPAEILKQYLKLAFGISKPA
jgi:hypothetical protein